MSRNIILVTIDSVRADHCGFMGYERDTTPTIDDMADNGFVYANAIAPGPSTYESMPSIFTGRLMTSFSATSDAADDYKNREQQIRLNMNRETISEWFRRQGYETAAFTANPFTGSHSGFARGFDYFEDFMRDGEGPLMRTASELPVLSELKHIATLIRGDRASKRWHDYYDCLAHWITEASEPYFLWVFLLDPHTPYLADRKHLSGVNQVAMYYHNWKLWLHKKWKRSPDDLSREKLISLYDAAIRTADDCLNQLWEDVRHTDPAIVLHSDHGEAFGEHGIFGHRRTLYEENVHVPLVAYNAGMTGQQSESQSLTALPSILRAIATEEDDLSNWTTPVTISKTLNQTYALRHRGWKYIGKVSRSGSVIEEELYDLESDEAETRNQIADYSELADACRRRIKDRFRHEREVQCLSESIGIDNSWLASDV